MMGYIVAHHFINVIGIVGVVIVLWTYLLLQLGKLSAKHLSYSIWNAIGSILILGSLLVHFNLASFVIEIAWLCISVYGIFHFIKTKKFIKE